MTIKRSLQFALSLVTLAVCTGTAQASQLGWWKLDETSGTTSSDGSGNGNDGTLQNMAGTEWTSGQDVGGLDFDGTNDYIDTGLSSNAATSITMMAWFKSDDLPPAGTIGNDEVAQRFITQRRTGNGSRLGLGLNNDNVAVY